MCIYLFVPENAAIATLYPLRAKSRLRTIIFLTLLKDAVDDSRGSCGNRSYRRGHAVRAVLAGRTAGAGRAALRIYSA